MSKYQNRAAPKANIYCQPELTDALYHVFSTSILSLFLLISLIFWELSRAGVPKYLLAWYFSFCGIILCRCGLFVWYNQTKHQINLSHYHYYLFIIGSSISALYLGFLGSFLMPEDMMHQAFVLILISGIVAGAVQSLSASYLANVIFIYFSLIPILTWEVIQIIDNKSIYVAILIAMGLFCIFSPLVARREYLMLVKHLELEFNYKILLERVSEVKDKYKKQATHDLLTGLYNRQFLNEYLKIEINKAKRKKLKIGIILLDIDFFKGFNDTYGHELGDRILQSLGNILNQSARKSDIACRYGGEEFVIVLPETSLASTRLVAESLRKTIKALSVDSEGKIVDNITVSLGVSCFPQHGLTRSKIINAADKAMYKAKREGRDRVCTASAKPNIDI